LETVREIRNELERPDHNLRCIKADWEARGHDVWFDKSDIRFGDDWRRAITDGIVGSNRVLSCFSNDSTRDPGVCLDEMAIAIGVKPAIFRPYWWRVKQRSNRRRASAMWFEVRNIFGILTHA
jgi:hypothetical protein